MKKEHKRINLGTIFGFPLFIEGEVSAAEEKVVRKYLEKLSQPCYVCREREDKCIEEML